ncbi:MAG: DUF4252 domain-containing protein [Acidobacteria bacterium]|nr:DUF4252 domain-containing protein [Acidobacteriota bacterium]
MRSTLIAFLLTIGMALTAHAQELKMPVDLDKLAAKASETTEVTLNAHMLQLAAKFMNDDEGDREARELVKKLKGIYVRSFEFDEPGAYSPSDVEGLRMQLKPPMWEKVVGVRSRRDGENAEVYFKSDSSDVIQGLVVIAADPRELTIVHIDGPLDPSDLEKLGGDFGVPRLQAPARPKAKPSAAGAQ